MAGVIVDRCPGVLRPHQAADGAMVRVRIPGGQTTGTAFARLGEIARTYGSGLLQLTSRGSVQLRGLPPELPDEVAESVSEAGFLPAPEHERVRNIAASPLTGLDGGVADLRPMVRALDVALQSARDLAELPGRFLFVLDDGRGDVSDLALDLGFRAVSADQGWLLVGSGAAGRPVATTAAVDQLILLARRFLTVHGGAWHVRDLPAPLTDGLEVAPGPSYGGLPLGVVGPHASLAVPLGLLSPDQLDLVTAVAGDGPLVVTPWRGIVLPGAADRLPELHAAGLVTDHRSSWTMLTACVGAPWCSSGRIDTRSLAHTMAGWPGDLPRTHLSGCERRCGAPTGDHLDLVAPRTAQARVSVAAYAHG